ncbi:MAG TPA: hypothetical protein PLE30_11500 [Candidatus Kapabacteria bacterium]|nr:hypothetical protein [Candidatus Kapabacteria bacterium]
MYSASFADDSHLRLLGGHGSGGGGGGRSLRSTQGFGPKTYDPYNINTSIGPVGASSSKKPKTWDGKGFTNFFKKEINEIYDLQVEFNTEYGFLVIWNHAKQEMRTSKYIKGTSSRTLSTIQDMLKEITLEFGDVVLGFFHSHGTNKTVLKNSFSDGDLANFHDLVFEAGNYSYTKIPTNKSSMFMGVVTPLTIEMLQVGDIEAFQELWNKVSSYYESKLKNNYFYKPRELGGVKYYCFPRR